MDDFNNSSYNDEARYERRMISPEAESNGMAKASKICGIISVISIVTLMIYPAIMLGSVAIILALLSRGKSARLPDKARTGLTAGIVALVVNIALVGGAVAILFSDGEYKQQINSMCAEMYGQTFDAMVEDAMDGSLDLEYHNLPGQFNLK